MPIERFPATASAADVAVALGREGCAIVERLVPKDLLEQARDELSPYIDATPFGSDEFAGQRTRRTGGLLARSVTCRDLVMHPLVLETVRRVLSHATTFQLHLTQMIAIGPGETAQTIHRDQWAFDFFPFPSGYEVQCNTIWAMNDFSAANGATRVIPGSNRFADRLRFTEAACLAERGSGRERWDASRSLGTRAAPPDVHAESHVLGAAGQWRGTHRVDRFVTAPIIVVAGSSIDRIVYSPP